MVVRPPHCLQYALLASLTSALLLPPQPPSQPFSSAQLFAFDTLTAIPFYREDQARKSNGADTPRSSRVYGAFWRGVLIAEYGEWSKFVNTHLLFSACSFNAFVLL